MGHNRYKIEDTLGQGGMGTVYRAYDRLTGQHLALKRVTAPQESLELFTRLPSDSSMNIALANEFRTLASLRHPNIIPVLDYGFEGNTEPFFTMRLLENALPVDAYAANLSQSEKIELLLQILQALRYLHRRGILHRDLKPSNVLVAEGRAYLLDFGLALDYAKNQGDAAGTLAYLAPEILQGQHPSILSDLYAFGVLAYEILAGLHPFASKTNSELIHKVLSGAVEVDSSRLSDEIALVLLRLLSKDPKDRYSSAAEVIRALAEAADYPLAGESEEIRESFLLAASFVGREGEIKQLSSALEDALAGKGQAWLIAGESGVGKSRLMDELRSRALVQGVAALRGQAVSEGGLPYQLWREIVRNLLLDVPVSAEEAYILKLLVPDIEALLEITLPDLKLDSMAIQKRLPLLILNLLNEAAKEKPLLLLLEDLQWAAEGIEILKAVSQGISLSRIMIVANYRSDESPQLPESLSNMQILELSRLSESSIRQLSEAILGETGKQSDVLDLIQRETEGNAFFIVEVVRALAEEAGTLSDIGRSTLPAQIFAGGIQKIIERRLGHLPAWALPASQLAAIIGREVKLDLMRYLKPELDLDTWLSRNAEAAVFTANGDSWQFAHDKLREYLRDNLPPAERKLLHLQVGQALETLYSAQIKDYAVLLTQHFAAAGDSKKEGQYAIMAAEALVNANPRDARQYIKRAIALNTQEFAENPPKQLASMQLTLAQCHIRLNELAAAREALEISSTIYQQIGDEIGVAICKHHLGEVGFFEGRLEEALPILHEALAVLIKTDDWRNIGYCYMNIGVIYGRQREALTARDYFEKCLAAMEKTGDGLVIAQALNNLAINYDVEGDWDKAIELYNRSLAIRRELKDKRGIAYSLANLGALAFDQERFADAKALRQEALILVKEVGDRAAESNLLDALGNHEVLEGNYQNALNYYDEALLIAQKIGVAYLEPMILLHIGETQEKMGADGKKRFLEALTVAKQRDIVPNKRSAVFQLALWHSKKGDKALAVECLVHLQQSHPDYAGKNVVEALEALKSAMDTNAYESGLTKNSSLDDLINKLLEEEKHD